MAVATLIGHGDPDVQELLPATVSPDRVALVGLRWWPEDDLPNIAEWGIRSFSPDELRQSTRALLDWIAATGCSRVAIHFDVDAVDAVDGKEIVLGLVMEPDGLTSTEVRRIVADVAGAVDVVGFTIAEFIPRQVIRSPLCCSRIIGVLSYCAVIGEISNDLLLGRGVRRRLTCMPPRSPSSLRRAAGCGLLVSGHNLSAGCSSGEPEGRNWVSLRGPQPPSPVCQPAWSNSNSGCACPLRLLPLGELVEPSRTTPR